MVGDYCGTEYMQQVVARLSTGAFHGNEPECSPVQCVLIQRGKEGKPGLAKLGHEVQVLIADLIVAGNRRSGQRNVLLHLRTLHGVQYFRRVEGFGVGSCVHMRHINCSW